MRQLRLPFTSSAPSSPFCASSDCGSRQRTPGSTWPEQWAGSLFISPYNYDYDLSILGLAIAYVLPELLARTRSWEIVLLGGLTWLTTGWGILVYSFVMAGGKTDPSGIGNDTVYWSFPTIGLTLLVMTAAAILQREPLRATLPEH